MKVEAKRLLAYAVICLLATVGAVALTWLIAWLVMIAAVMIGTEGLR